MKTIVIGSGGHASVCIEALFDSGYEPIYCISKSSESFCNGIPVANGDDKIKYYFDNGVEYVFVALGNNLLRHSLAVLSKKIGFKFATAISKHSIVSKSAIVLPGSALLPGSIVNSRATISSLAIVNTGSLVEHDCRINYSSHVAPHCSLAGSVSVGRFSLIGIGSTVVPGVRIGAYSAVGAASLILNDVPSNCTVAGSPAKPIAKHQY